MSPENLRAISNVDIIFCPMANEKVGEENDDSEAKRSARFGAPAEDTARN